MSSCETFYFALGYRILVSLHVFFARNISFGVGTMENVNTFSISWQLTPDVQRVINGVNSRMVSIVTGQTQKEEATAGARSFDIVRAIRARRLQWMGQILRMDPDRLLIKAVRLMYDKRAEGDILSDAPTTDTWAELKAWVADEKK